MLSSETEKYDFIESLGRGMFAEVARFQRQSDRKMVAVKRMPRVHTRLCLHEARVLAALTDENAYDHHIVRFYEAFGDEFHVYLVEEVMGQNLHDFQKANSLIKFKIRDIRTVVLQVATALAKLKDMGVVHADIKQENIVLVNQRREPFRVKLIDFGSAITTHDLASMWTPYIQPRFVRAPEVLLGYRCTEKIDVWSLACVMGEMALGRTLFPSRCELELAHSIFGSRGFPSATMLEASIKTKLFFDLVDNGRGAHELRVKPYQGRELFTGTQSLRRHVPANLELLQALEDLAKGYEEQELAESADHRCLVDLLNRMLVLEPEQRISPNQALRHPFLTLQHLQKRGNYRSYYNFALQGYSEAGVTLPQDRSDMYADSSEEIVLEVPKRKKRSLRRSLRSLFTRLFTRRRKKQPAAAQGNKDGLEGSASCAVPGDQPAQNTGSEEQACEDQCQSPTAGSSVRAEESTAHEEPPKKKGFMRWMRTVASCFSGCRGKKAVATEDSNSSL
ncbi:homeodomain-interacting protein kinase 4-like [Anguilla rostrata]|uniref:homeodomain-interacting protein kinase 4-like n=1 Tax=Anguilla rostrata TaxID=7938 RepID=UPI0030CDA97E